MLDVKAAQNTTVLQQKKARRKQLIRRKRSHKYYAETLKLLGWEQIPSVLLAVITKDIDLWQQDIATSRCNIEEDVRLRRNRVCYWVNMYLDKNCSLKTALSSLES